MIRKFVSITNVGMLVNHSAVRDQQLREFNIIYSDNGQGKTMLAAILDSARSGSPGIVLGRATLGATEPPRVDILTDGDMIRFDGGSWSREARELEVFYSGFVSRAVHAGSVVTVDHKRGLCDFALGPSAVALLRQIEDLTETIKAITKDVAAKEQVLRAHTRGSLDLDRFIALPDTDDVSEALAQSRKAVVDARNSAAILGTPAPVPLPAFEPDFTRLPAALGRGLTSISAAAVERVAGHLRERLGSDGERWIATGMTHLRGTGADCPFCGKPTHDSELVAAYHQYFDEEYVHFASVMGQDLDAIGAECDVASFDRAASLIEQARGALLVWARYCDLDTAALAGSLEQLRSEWAAASAVVKAALERKRTNPIAELALDPFEAQAIVRLETCASLLNEHIREVASAAGLVEEYRARLSSSNPEELQLRVTELENREQRTKPETKVAVRVALEARRRRADAIEQKDALKSELNAKMELVGGSYADGINHFLEAFGTDLRVVVAERPSYSGGKPSLNYQLELGGIGIPLDGPHDGAEPCFGNTLSDGDKNALGLAFFMARLRAMTDLSSITVVFDDPVTSLDETRRQRTIREIVALSNRGAQVVVLTHDPGLALALYSDRGISTAPVALCITREGQTNCIREWDIERAAATPYIRNFLRVEALIRGEVSAEDGVHAIRPFIEDNIRHRFPGRFAPRQNLGHMLSAIAVAGIEDDLSVLKAGYDDLDEVNDYTTAFEHGSSGNPAAGALVDSNVLKCARQAMKVAGLTCD